MSSRNTLRDKVILVVDDEPDIIDTIKEELDMCLVHSATDHDTALQHLLTYNYDIVILDIMGVDGFDLLKKAVQRGFPTVMLTAHALSPESLKKAIKLGAVSFLPKEKIPELPQFLEDVVLGGGRPVWKKLFDKLGNFFDNRFGKDWEKKDRYLREFIEDLKAQTRDASPS